MLLVHETRKRGLRCVESRISIMVANNARGLSGEAELAVVRQKSLLETASERGL